MIELIKIQSFKKKARKRYVFHLALVILLITLTISGSLISLFLSNLDYALNLLLNIFVYIFVGLFLIFYFLNIFPIVDHYYKFYKDLDEVSLEHRRRLVFNNEEKKKDIGNTSYRVLSFAYEEASKSYTEFLYVLDSDVQFNKNQEYKLLTYKNVIIRYEEL